MVIDVIKTQFPQLKRVIQFVCGNGLVCETVDEARHVAFDGPERRKVRRWGRTFGQSEAIFVRLTHYTHKYL